MEEKEKKPILIFQKMLKNFFTKTMERMCLFPCLIEIGCAIITL